MPPGRHRSGPRARMRVNGASISSLLNADARTDQEIRRNVRLFFGTWLALVLSIDLASAVSLVWISCGIATTGCCNSGGNSGNTNSNSNSGSPRWTCFLESVLHFSSEAEKDDNRNRNHNQNLGDDENDTLGDFVVLSLVRCLVTLLLLWIGVRFGREGNRRNPFPTTSGTAATTSATTSATATIPSGSGEHESGGNAASLMEPLLSAGHPDHVEDGERAVEGSHSTTSTATATTTATSSLSTEIPPVPSPTLTPTPLDSPSFRSVWDPNRVKNTVLLLVILLCTLYQVYAGLRVATMQDIGIDSPSSSSSSSSSTRTTRSVLRIVLLCATVLWINAEAYLVRVLILELTRNDEGLFFLPPEVHRHPLYLETDHRSMAMHWCDMCGQRISTTIQNNNNSNNNKQNTAAIATVCQVATTPATTTSGTATAPTTSASTNGATNAPSSSDNRKTAHALAGGYCYRCALCDFDICLACSSRSDAAVVGENVLRGDRGVRTETSLSTSDYVKRSFGIAGKSEWPWLTVSFALLALSSFSRLLLPHVQGKIIDQVVPIPTSDDNNSNNNNNNDNYNYEKKVFVHYIVIYILIMIAQGAFSTLYSAIFTLVSRRLKFTIRNALLEKILVQDVAYFDGTESGRLISRLTNDLDMMMAPIQSSLSNLLSNCLILVGGMVVCFLKSYRLSMLAFVTVGPISYLWEQYALWSKGLAREMLSYWAQGNSIAAQALSHIRTVKAFGCEEVVLRQYSETNRMALDCGVKDAWGNGITMALTGYLDLGTGVLILYFGGLLVYRGEMSVGDLVTYQLFWNMMNNAYQNLQGLVTSFTRSAAGAEKVFSLWDSDPDIDPQKGNDVPEDRVQGHLQLKDVGFYYQMRPDNMVLEGFNLEIPAGKTLALVGRSGGGKSTIINLLLRFYDPKQGAILLDNMPYESLRVHQLRRLFGVVTQDTELFALTVEENIAYGLDKEDYTFEEVVEAAKKAYAHDFICEMKDGYQTRIGERGGRISGGQRQRLAIARVFLRRPKIILLDEATSALDEKSQEAVQRALGDLIRESNATVVMVAHRLSTVVNADSICVIDKGRVLEQGSHEELLQKGGGIYASMVSSQSAKTRDLLNQEREQREERKRGHGRQKKQE